MAKSLQDILKRRQQEEFVGREEQLAFFRRNLRYEPDDDRRRFVINISGQGGVGKSWLLRRFRKIAEEAGAVTAYTDEAEDDVPGVMGRIVAQFDAQGYLLRTFAERYKVYRQRRQEIETDPDAPQGFPALLGRTLAKGGLRLARRVPIGGVAADFVDEEVFASLAGDFASYVARKIGNKDEVRLVLEPVEVLTPLFLADLRKVAEEHPLALLCDTYERTGEFLDPWLRDLLEGCHGDVPANILLVIAERDTLDHNLWAPYEGLLARLSVNPFTDEEARDYLARKGVTDEQVIEVILGLSGRLPLLVATLAAESPDDPAKVGDPSGEAVERFLKWVEGPKQRQVALDAALPRRLNRDVLAVMVGEEEASELFAWLRGRPFVESRGDGWAYHDVVREQMLQHKRQESPKDWADLHGRLAKYYDGLWDGLELTEEAGRKDETGQEYVLEALYHRLCQASHKHLPNALAGFLMAVEQSQAFCNHWAETVHQAGTETGTAVVQLSGQQMLNSIDDFYYGRSYDSALAMLNLIEEQLPEDSVQRVAALARRALLYGLSNEHQKALADYGRVIDLQPGNAKWFVGRALVLRQIERYDEALADYAQAIELEPKTAKWLRERASLLTGIERYDKALADYNRAIELEPENAWNFQNRAGLLKQVGRNDEALSDYTHAIELGPEKHFRFGARARFLDELGRYEEAIADYTCAIELRRSEKTGQTEKIPKFKPGDRVVFVGGHDYELKRGNLYQATGRYDEALTDYTTAIKWYNRFAEHELDRVLLAECSIKRGSLFTELRRFDEAHADLSRAIELMPENARIIAHRGLVHMEEQRYDQALADLSHAIDLDADHTLAIANRGVVYLMIGCYKEALSDLNRAAEYEHDNASILANLGSVYRLLGQHNEALTNFDRAIELYPDYAWAIANRGVTYVQMERYEEALADFGRVIELDFDHARALASRGETYLLMKHYEEALADFDRAIKLDPDYTWAVANRGQVLQALERYEEALADFDQAIELDPDEDQYFYNRALTYRLVDQANKAEADLAAAIQRAREACEKEPQDWRNTLNLALYQLAARKTEGVERLYREALSGGISPYPIRKAIRDLDDLLALFSDHPHARAMRDLLQEHLQEAER